MSHNLTYMYPNYALVLGWDGVAESLRVSATFASPDLNPTPW